MSLDPSNPLHTALVSQGPSAPWRQQPGEPIDAYAAFALWALAGELALPEGVNVLADRWRWVVRKQQLDVRLRDNVPPHIAMQQAGEDLVYIVCAKAREIRSQVERGVDGLRPRDVIEIMRLILTPQHAALAAQQSEPDRTDPHHFLDLERLDPDERDEFYRLHAKCWRRRE